MRTIKLLGVTLAVAAVLAQAGCSRDSELSKDGATSESGSAAAERRDNSVTLPEGTVLTVRTTSTLSTKTQQTGQPSARLWKRPAPRRRRCGEGRGGGGTIVESIVAAREARAIRRCG